MTKTTIIILIFCLILTTFAQDKTLSLNINISDQGSEIIDYSIKNSKYRGVKYPTKNKEDLLLAIFNQKGDVLYEKYFHNPQSLNASYEGENGVLTSKFIHKKSAYISVSIPFFENSTKITLYELREDLKNGFKNVELKTFDLTKIKKRDSKELFPIHTLVENGDLNKKINIVFVGDGYTAEEMSQYRSDVEIAFQAILNESPYDEYSEYFNGYAIEVQSQESGCKLYPTDTSPITYFESSFNSYGIERLLCVGNTSKVYSVINDSFEGTAHVKFVIVNSTKYGGSGGEFAVFSVHSSSRDLAIHEMGHSYADLADEYYYRHQENANQSDENSSELVRWKSWLGIDGINIYRHYSGDVPDAYKPSEDNCMMEYLSQGFCSVCKEHIVLTNYNNIDIIESVYPTENTIVTTEDSLSLRINPIIPDEFKSTTWTVNGEVYAQGIDSIKLDLSTIASDNFDVKVSISDINARVKKTSMFLYHTASGDVEAEGLLEESFTWNVDVSLSSVLNITTLINGANIELSWDSVPGAVSYNIYASDDPEGEFTYIDNSATTTWSELYTENKKFYYVIAVN